MRRELVLDTTPGAGYVSSMAQLPTLMTVAEVAKALRISDETVHRWVRDGRLEHINILGIKRFRRDYIAGLLGLPAEDVAA